MANQDEESKTDGLEIVSIGSIYTGAWDKKYWSSSRGKDRYPYPVGYQALRTHKGITYKMDINEGSKGPVFQITSNDRKSASGETPDRAWETFQKKCCSRIKLWHGKRFSGKMDGVEFFGFKNSLVQRLLRELVASVNGASERCSPVRNSEASVGGQNVPCILSNKHPDLVPYVKKSRITGKRSRSSRGDKTQICLPQNHINDAPGLRASLKTSKTDVDISQAGEDLPVFSKLENGIEVAPSAVDLPLMCHEGSGNSKTEPCLAQVQRELPSTGACTSASFNSNSPQEEKSLDRHHIEVGERGFQSTAEHGNEKAQVICDFPNSQAAVPVDSQVNHFGNLCAPDTLDTQQDITCLPDSGKYVDDHSASKNNLMASQLVTPEEPITESQSNEDTGNSNENSERSDYDLLDQEIVNKMLAVLLPQVAPLLTYSSRKKRRSNKKKSVSDVKQENESRGITDVISPAGACASSGVKEQLKTDAHFTNSTVSLSEKSGYVPDSLDNDQCEDHITDQLLLPSNNAETVATDMHKVNHESHRRGLQVVNSTIDTCCCPDQTNRTSSISPVAKTNNFEEMLSHKEIPQVVDRIFLEDGVEALPSKEEYSLNTYDSSKPLDSCCKKTEFEGALGVGINAGKQHSTSENTVPNLGSVVVLSNYTAPLSESIICRNMENHHVSDSHPEAAHMIVPDSFQVASVDDGDSRKASFGVEGSCEEQVSALLNENANEALTQKHNRSAVRGLASSCDINKDTIENQNCGSVGFSADHRSHCFPKHDVNEADSHESLPTNHKHNSGIEKSMKLIGEYSHLKRISSVLLSKKLNEMYLCVSCGLIEERTRDLLLYKLETEECSLGRPYMVGHTIMDLPVLKDEFGREVAVDNLGMQFTPDAGGLILADSIRMPYCREMNIHCSCSECKSYCFEENAIKIVEIKLGYVSLVLKLNTIHPVHCLLVCEPQHLIALDESGRIYIWVMSSTWRVESEAYVIPSYDLLTSRVVELKRIPKSASMIVGHNGYGEFSLWDIINRIVVSRFSAPASSVLEFLPISLFNWQKNGMFRDKLVVDECVKNLVETTMLWFSGHDEANSSCPKGKDIAVWLFIRTSSNSGYLSSRHLNLDGYWRLGLLINNVVVLGPVLHPSTAAVGTSAGHGIIGTWDGQVYVWELATGTKLGTMLDFEGCGVSHIATDCSASSAVAIGGDGGKLCVYLRS